MPPFAAQGFACEAMTWAQTAIWLPGSACAQRERREPMLAVAPAFSADCCADTHEGFEDAVPVGGLGEPGVGGGGGAPGWPGGGG